jgi:sortase A
MTTTTRRTPPRRPATTDPGGLTDLDADDRFGSPTGGSAVEHAGDAAHDADRRPEPDAPAAALPTGRSLAFVVGGWALVLLIAVLAVLYPLGPLFARRTQHALLADFRVEVQRSADATQGLAGLLEEGDTPPAPVPGEAVAILDLGPLGVQQVVVEGATASQTVRGPGHVPGTAGLGQPGNAVVVGRAHGAGGAFGSLGDLRRGDQIVATTTQGQSVYVVDSVTRRSMRDAVTAPSDDDRLTLVTSGSALPTNGSKALVVTAILDERPFEPTPQGGRDRAQSGTSGDPAALPSVVLFALLYAGAAALAVVLYRRLRPLAAYLLTTPAIVVLAILTAEAVLRLLPAWT